MSREAVPGTERGFVDSSGSILRKARVALGLTEEEVATELRLSARLRRPSRNNLCARLSARLRSPA
jgi:hypothetical protein